MSLHFTAAGAARPVALPSRLDEALRTIEVDRPTLVFDPQRVAMQYRALQAGLGRTHIHYAVKANPDRAVIETLIAEGSGFDAASRGEIELCLSLGAEPRRISFGNTIKRASDIAFAHQAGITLFAADASDELVKIAAHAPGAQVYIRLLVERTEADWPLSRKFGCTPEVALELMGQARDLGLDPVGISFHVGSQTRKAAMWDVPLADMAAVWHAARDAGFDMRLLNIGGGFPAFYGEAIEAPTAYASQVMALVDAHFGTVEQIMAEPGRGLVAEAGAIVAEVMLVSRKRPDDLHRWVYLDIGKFSGLAETIDEAIRYQFETARDDDAMGPCVLAGPSCDSADVLYEQRPVQLPLSLATGDRIVIRNTGAYTTTYASIGFNGFPPLDVIVL